jgi:hypothetical protein
MNKLLLFAISITAISSTAMAQETPKAEVFGGYAYAGAGSNGFDMSVVGNLNDWLGLGADISGQYTRINESGIREHRHELFPVRIQILSTKKEEGYTFRPSDVWILSHSYPNR